MNFYKLKYFSVSSIILTVFSILCSPIYASDNEEEDLRDKFHQNMLLNKDKKEELNESSFIVTIQTLVNKKDAIKPLENSLQIMRTGIDNIISTQLVNIEEISDVKNTLQETKEKTVRTQSILKDMKRDLENPIQPLVKSSNLARSKNLGELDNFLSSMGLYINWGMSEGDIKNKIHQVFASQSTHSIDVPYSGTVNYSGSAYYSGNVSYSGNAYYSGSTSVGGSSATYWSCNKCNYADNSWSINYCGSCTKLYSQSPGYKQYTKSISGGVASYSGYAPYSGSQSYTGYAPYNGSQSYSGTKTTTCTHDHHKCACDKWASVILSFRENLEEKDYYKNAFEKQKASLQSLNARHIEVSKDVEEMAPKLNVIQDKSLVALSTIQSERQLFLNGFRDQMEKTAFAFNVMNQLNESEQAFQKQILTVVKNNEEEQRKEKTHLQEEIKKKEENKNLEIQNIMEQQKNINQSIIEDSKEKAKLLSEKDNQILSLINEKHKLDIEHLQKEVSLNQVMKEEGFKNVLAQKNKEREQELLENNMRNFAEYLFGKLCEKSGFDLEESETYSNNLVDEKVPLSDTIKKVKLFINKQDRIMKAQMMNNQSLMFEKEFKSFNK